MLEAPQVSFQSAVSKLVPFFLSVYLYFAYNDSAVFKHVVLATILKCLPILCLAWYLWVYEAKNYNEHDFGKKMLKGMVLCCFGDAFLLWDKFIPGMIAFGIGHVYYILAFGFFPLKLHYGLPLYIICGFVLYQLMPGLKGVLVYGVPVYAIILVTMVWRIFAHMHNEEGITSWSRKFVALCGVSWVISDATLGWNKFNQQLPYAQFIIMGTYYFGQLGLAWSPNNCYKTKKA